MSTVIRMLLAAQILAVSLLLVVAARATTIQSTYHHGGCRFAGFSSCAATGSCDLPTGRSAAVYTHDSVKVQPRADNASSAIGTPLLYACPLTRVLSSSPSAPSIAVQMAGAGTDTKPFKCTLYSRTNYGDVSGSFQAADQITGTTAGVMKNLKLSASNSSGHYALWCEMPVESSDGVTRASTMNSYRAEEVGEATKTSIRRYPSSICVPSGPSSNLAGKLRYYSDRAENVGTGNLTVECALPNFRKDSENRRAYVYLREKATAGGSVCRLRALAPWSSDLRSGKPTSTTTAAGTASFSFTDLTGYGGAPVRYLLECTLTPGSAIHTLSFGST